MQRQWTAPAPAERDDGGLPVLPELAACFAGAVDRTAPEPVGGSAELRDAACGYWSRRGLWTDPAHVVVAPGAEPLLLALLASASGGDVLLPRPCAAWYAPLVRLVDRRAYHAPVPAECGGLPDPFALLETVRRIRAEDGRPRMLLLSVADDPTGTVAPPELLHEVCEAAAAEGLLIVSDETWRDTVHHPHGTVLLSPAEMCPENVIVLSDLVGAFTPAGWPAAIARFPATERGVELRTRVLSLLTAVRSGLPAPVAAAAAHALDEPSPVRARTAAAARAHGAVATAAYRALTALGALCRPPQAGRHLYADLDELRGVLAARNITDSVELERELSGRIGRAVAGGHRFGDPPHTLRVRLSTLPLLGAADEQRLRSLEAPDPLELPHVKEALAAFDTAFRALIEDGG
ncbi:aminotransferase class I/II-fold pyridoxal phosphate-dependent enzyme [Streptomyces sp. NA02950]|uniref:aminotransferase class I/II-fold pyridoxal phosphate-dependent enzyme n=1 Tax=Streptomyces sp. NA02950 TaxID=2742137 RepID=UPI00159005E0|nr:aminotransferase class I/II-fold pyridoxal phosphate-dependent enzyme [Streptomyces sp. NA02950]QKV91865.1 aminotransferase class I/II-fold pyridoxal phosphate-dependent enzyme [Streptomyces sp. NA02950]